MSIRQLSESKKRSQRMWEHLKFQDDILIKYKDFFHHGDVAKPVFLSKTM